MVIYGKNAVSEALRAGQAQRVLLALGLQPRTVRELTKLAKQAGIPLDFVPRIDLDRLLRTTNHQGVAAEVPDPHYADTEAPWRLAEERDEELLLVTLDHISDPRNLGAIIRTAEALGAHGVVTEERRAAKLTATVMKCSAGAIWYLPLIQVKNLPRYLQELKERGVWIYGAAPDGDKVASEVDWRRRAALVIGSEGSGLRRLVRDSCDELIRIPLRGKLAALNASVATGILVHSVLWWRQQQEEKQSG